jgi:hypothetical protein
VDLINHNSSKLSSGRFNYEGRNTTPLSQKSVSALKQRLLKRRRFLKPSFDHEITDSTSFIPPEISLDDRTASFDSNIINNTTSKNSRSLGKNRVELSSKPKNLDELREQWKKILPRAGTLLSETTI